MTLNANMMNAVLSMDSYNRGYGQALDNIGGVGSSIGNAILTTESNVTQTSDEVQAGFYAAAYSLNGETIISYRGTDDPFNGVWDVLTSPDIWNGWATGAGSTEAKQAGMEECRK